VLEVEALSKDYETPRGPLSILSSVDLSLSEGEAVSIMGPSGCGKSTLLYILGALEPPTSGVVRLRGQNPFELDRRRLARFRNTHVGFVFQDHALLPQLTVLENVLTPTLVAKQKDSFTGRARELLSEMGLDDRLDHRPAELSGGEKQRVAVARALILRPTLLLCDEPTGNLDGRSAESVGSLLLNLPTRKSTILIVVTHSRDLAARFETRYELRDGKLVLG